MVFFCESSCISSQVHSKHVVSTAIAHRATLMSRTMLQFLVRSDSPSCDAVSALICSRQQEGSGQRVHYHLQQPVQLELQHPRCSVVSSCSLHGSESFHSVSPVARHPVFSISTSAMWRCFGSVISCSAP